VAPEVVAAVSAMVACSRCDTALVVATRSQEAAMAGWMVLMVAMRSDRATSIAADVTTTMPKSVSGGVALTKAGMRQSGESRPDRV
jgi:hypothetical protein